jgi:UDP-N-acetylglucosamine transferase subunit ALG13
VILVAVGTQFPFDRLTRAVDAWAESVGRDDIVAQIGPTDFQPKRMKCFDRMTPDEFAALQRQAEVIVAHAGMGSILEALAAGRPIIVMPREHARGEHRNDHQIATANRFADVAGVHVARDEAQLRALLDRLGELERGAGSIGASAPEPFLQKLRAFVEEAPRRGRRRAP